MDSGGLLITIWGDAAVFIQQNPFSHHHRRTTELYALAFCGKLSQILQNSLVRFQPFTELIPALIGKFKKTFRLFGIGYCADGEQVNRADVAAIFMHPLVHGHSLFMGEFVLGGIIPQRTYKFLSLYPGIRMLRASDCP